MTEATADLSAFLTPRSIAIVGASADRSKVGAQPLRYLRKYGFDGVIYPVNPRGGTIDGLTCYPDIAAIPNAVDCAIIVTAGEHVLLALESCAARGVRGAVVISAGFGEMGAAGREAETRMRAFAARGMRLLGPNNQGTVNLLTGTVVGFNPLLETVEAFRAGSIGLVSQSSGVGFGLLGLGLERGLGFSHLVTTGNEADLSFAECGLALLELDAVRVVVGALEGVKDAAALRRLAERSHALGKPVVVLKGAKSASGGRAAVSHTGSLAGQGAVFSAFCRQHGLIEADDFDHLLDLAQTFSGRSPPRPGGRVAVLTGTGGTAVLMADALERNGFAIPPSGPDTAARLREILPAVAVVTNPIDMTTANLANSTLFPETVRILAADPTFDTLALVVGPAVGQRGLDYAGQILAAREAWPSLFVSWTAPNGQGQALLRDAGVPLAPSPQRIVRAMAAARGFFGAPPLRETGTEASAVEREARVASARAILNGVAGPQVAEHAAKALCRIWQIPVPGEKLVRDAAAAVATANEIGYPVALKLQSPAIGHKTEIGGVLLDCGDAQAVAAGVAHLFNVARQRAPGAEIDGILVQEMVRGQGEAIVGVVADPALGSAVMAGPGGVLAEIVDDVSFRLAPFGRGEAARLRAETRLGRLMTGVRGGPPWDVEAFDNLVARVSLMASELAGLIDEIDLNPVIVREMGGGAIVVDALMSKSPAA